MAYDSLVLVRCCLAVARQMPLVQATGELLMAPALTQRPHT